MAIEDRRKLEITATAAIQLRRIFTTYKYAVVGSVTMLIHSWSAKRAAEIATYAIVRGKQLCFALDPQLLGAFYTHSN